MQSTPLNPDSIPGLRKVYRRMSALRKMKPLEEIIADMERLRKQKGQPPLSKNAEDE